MQLYPYQRELNQKIKNAWNVGNPNILAAMPTGGGKTAVFSQIVKDFRGPSVTLAHRREILAQIAMTFARFQIPHAMVAPRATVREIIDAEHRKVGRSYVVPGAQAYLASVDTLLARKKTLSSWSQKIKLWVQDEAHHLLKENKWGRAIAMFQNARGLGVTATPLRADGKSLGRAGSGIFDTLVEGPTTRELIEAGYLADYRLFAPSNSIEISRVSVGSSGDFHKAQLREASRKSQIVGDIVSHYKNFAAGKRTLVFCVDIETAKAICERFQIEGFRAAHVDGGTPERERGEKIRQFKGGDISILTNVELFSEGFDVPGVECVIFGRPTWSYALFSQQFGRLLRKNHGKNYGIAIDAVGNVQRHGLPDKKQEWSLDQKNRRQSKSENQGPPLRVCGRCFRVSLTYSWICRFCGYKPVLKNRASIEEIEGDLTEVSPDILKQLRERVAKIDSDPQKVVDAMLAGGSVAAALGFQKRHEERKKAQSQLRDTIALWAGWGKAAGMSDSELYIKFYRLFGVDVVTAQALGRRAAEDLTFKIEKYGKSNI